MNRGIRALAKLGKYLLELECTSPDIIQKPNAFTDNKQNLLTIEKELKILEILKKRSNIVEMYCSTTRLGTHFVCETKDKKELKILKEWLEND